MRNSDRFLTTTSEKAELLTCAICGKPITEVHISVDHVFPRAIYKWLKQEVPWETWLAFKKTIDGIDNMVPVHRKCNVEKEDSTIDIESLHCSEKKKEALRNVRDEISPYLSIYNNRKDNFLIRQGGSCYNCGKSLTGTQVLRRIDRKKPRIWQNGCLVCHVCNLENPDFTEVGKEKQNAEKGK